MKRLLIGLTLLIAGCANTQGFFGMTFNPQTPQQAVFAAKAGYEVALTAAVAYRALPLCSATVKLPCSEAAVVSQLQKSQPAARAALDAAEEAVRSPKFDGTVANTAIAASEAALKAFVAITATLPRK